MLAEVGWLYSRMVVFGSQVAIDYLRSCDHWHMDGTFDTVPSQFRQLYTIHKREELSLVCMAYLPIRDRLLTKKKFNLTDTWLELIRYR